MKRITGSLALALLLMFGTVTARAALFAVDAFTNSSSGSGVGLNTGIVLSAGQAFTVTAAADDLWSAGALPRWSNADGLIGDTFATGTDESGEPAGTQSFGVTMYDPDAPAPGGWWHWTVFNIPAGVHGLAANAGAGTPGLLPAGAGEGRNDFGFPHYGGPCPPPGAPHRYEITVYALKTARLPLGPDSPGARVAAALRANALATARITGLYGRR